MSVAMRRPTPEEVAARAREILADSEPPARYWLDHAEVERRRAVLAERYERIGLHRSGREHRIDFATA
ncbi:hypothetical protein ACFVW2_24140 [Streptomyces sp. NPDC058171]